MDWIWLKELDENNELIAERIENEFNEQNISDERLAESIRFWNEIQPVSTIIASQQSVQDSVYTITRQNPYAKREIIDRFRGLKTTIKINKKKLSFNDRNQCGRDRRNGCLHRHDYIGFLSYLDFRFLDIEQKAF
ncbi:hypothetical protein [Sphingobacterium hungaricum]|uniref:hypothetical protein n=1 Tax=Sphingobacterium hungaricum TaxID=2082723 RepID=UPI0018CB886F